DTTQVRGQILRPDLDLDADLGQLLLGEFGGPLQIAAIGQEIVEDLEAHAVCLARKTGLVKQRFRALRIVGILWRVGIEELRRGAGNRPFGSLALTLPDYFDQRLAVDSVQRCLSDEQ